MRSKYGLGLLDQLHNYILVVGSAYQDCLLIIRYAIFTSYQTACVRSESDETGASLTPTWHDQTLDGDVTLCLLPSQLIAHVADIWLHSTAAHTLYITVQLSIFTHSSGAVWESRWTSWAVRPNEPSGFRGRKELLNRASALVTTCP